MLFISCYEIILECFQWKAFFLAPFSKSYLTSSFAFFFYFSFVRYYFFFNCQIRRILYPECHFNFFILYNFQFIVIVLIPNHVKVIKPALAITYFRAKSLQDCWGAAFVYNWQLPLIFVWFTSNFLCICTYCTAHAQEVWGKSDKD